MPSSTSSAPPSAPRRWASSEWVCSPLNVGGGTVHCAHGTLPVPAPATARTAEGRAHLLRRHRKRNCVTPTGAAIVRALASSFGPLPLMHDRKRPATAPARAIFAGHRQRAAHQHRRGAARLYKRTPPPTDIAILEANLDDVNPQLIGYVQSMLALAAGALDVFSTPVQMKKNRPGTLLTVLARPENEAQLRALLFRREHHPRRAHAPRATLRAAAPYVTVTTPWGEVRSKSRDSNGDALSHYAPEYEDCRRIAVAAACCR